MGNAHWKSEEISGWKTHIEEHTENNETFQIHGGLHQPEECE